MRSPQRGRLVLGGLLALALIALFLRGVDLAALGRALRAADLADLCAVAAIVVVMYAVRAWRWGYLLAPLARVPLARLFSVTVVGFMAGLVVPRAQEVVRPYLVGRGYGVRTPAAFASIILERLVDLIAVLVLFGLYLYVLPPPAAQAHGRLIDHLKGAGMAAGLAALGVLGVLLLFHYQGERALVRFDRLFRRLPFGLGRPLGDALRSFGAGLAVLQAPLPHLLAILGQSFLLWLLIDLSVYVNNRAFGIDLPFHATFLIVGFLVVGVAVPTPGMVGGYHVAYREALTQTYGIPAGTAAAAGITGHALSNLPVLLIGLWLLRSEGLTLGRVAEMAERDENAPARPKSLRLGSSPGEPAEASAEGVPPRIAGGRGLPRAGP